MKQITFRKKHKIFFIAGIIAMPALMITSYNWWLIAIVIIIFLVIAFMTKGPTQNKKEL